MRSPLRVIPKSTFGEIGCFARRDYTGMNIGKHQKHFCFNFLLTFVEVEHFSKQFIMSQIEIIEDTQDKSSSLQFKF